MRWPTLKLQRYPIWSAKSVALLAGVTVAATAILVFAISGKPILSELLTTLAILAGSLFIFLTIGLYRGVRMKKEQPFTKLAESAPRPAQKPGLRHELGQPIGEAVADVAQAAFWSEEVFIGCVVGFIVWITLVVLATVLWDSGALWAVGVAFYWLFSRALRQVFIHAAKCHGNILRSLQYAAGYTVLYTGWMFALLMLAKRL